MLANAGHFDVEIDLDALGSWPRAGCARCSHWCSSTTSETGGSTCWPGPRGEPRRGQGHPSAVMDMSFANLALGVEHLVLDESLAHRVLAVPRDIDDAIARLKLESLGVAIDDLTADQEDYLSAWTGRPA